jgi:glutathione S-transferase
MSELVLHRYDFSNYSEKVRVALGYKSLEWSSVIVPPVTPKPDLTGGYRRAPVLHIGADIYYDTRLILRELERRHPLPSLYPPGQNGLANAVAAWAEGPLFRSVMLDGRKFILSADPSAADLSAYHPVWFARQNGGQEVNELIAFAGVIDPWYLRVAAIGHGTSSKMSPDQAIEIAKANEPSEPHEWSREAQNVGLCRGDWVSVTPDDYGNSVYGSLLSWAHDEIVLRHEDPSVGKVNLRFPRVGFDTLGAEKKVA